MTYAMKIEEERELAEAKGREEGRKEGRKEVKIEIVEEMLREHQPPEFIARITKFSSEKILEIGKIRGLL